MPSSVKTTVKWSLVSSLLVALLGFIGNEIYDKAVTEINRVHAIEKKQIEFAANQSSDAAQWRLIKEQEDKLRVLETQVEVNKILVDKFTNYSLMIHGKSVSQPKPKEPGPIIFEPKAPPQPTINRSSPPKPSYILPLLTPITPKTIEEETKEKYEEVLKELKNHKSENVRQYQQRQQSLEGTF
jgi:hypothetical protein